MGAARNGRRAPVTLRDFLELGCESSSDGFRSYPRQKQPSNKSPPAFFFPNKSPGSALARISSLSRSFSRRITFSFWRRITFSCADDDLDDRDSCGFPSPLVSSCTASQSSEYAESETDIVIEHNMSFFAPAPVSESEEVSPSASSTSSGADDVPVAAGNGHVDEALGDGDPAVGRSKLEDKQQLSPVSVLDFPFDDEDGDEERSDAGTCSPSCFRHHQHHANLQRTKKAHKFRRFGDGPATEADVDLEARFTTTLESGEEESVEDDAHHPSCNTDDTEAANTTAPRHQSIGQGSSQLQEPADEYRLLSRLLDDDDVTAALDEISEWLLLDFFAEGLPSSVVGKAPLDDGNKLRTAAALDWLRGAGPQWGIGDVMFSGESALKEMERSRRWMCVREEERDVGAEVEAFVMDGMLDELVTDCWCGDS